MKTVADALTNIRLFLREPTDANYPNGRFWQNSELLAWMNAGVCKTIYYLDLKRVGKGDSTINVVANQYSYNLPSDFVDFLEVRFNGHVIDYIQPDEWEACMFPRSTAATSPAEASVPAFYTVMDVSSTDETAAAVVPHIVLYPTPATAITGGLVVKYKKSGLPTMVASGAVAGQTNYVPLPVELEELPEYWALDRAFRKKGDLNNAQLWKREFMAAIEDARAIQSGKRGSGTKTMRSVFDLAQRVKV